MLSEIMDALRNFTGSSQNEALVIVVLVLVYLLFNWLPGAARRMGWVVNLERLPESLQSVFRVLAPHIEDLTQRVMIDVEEQAIRITIETPTKIDDALLQDIIDVLHYHIENIDTSDNTPGVG